MSGKLRNKKKKQSAGSRRYQTIRKFIDNVAIAQVQDHPLCFIDLNNYSIKNPSNLLCHSFVDIEHRWNILLAVSCLESNGKTKLTLDEFRLPIKCHQSDLGDSVNERHCELIEACSEKMEVRFIGWLASANGKQFDLEKVDALFELMMNGSK